MSKWMMAVVGAMLVSVSASGEAAEIMKINSNKTSAALTLTDGEVRDLVPGQRLTISDSTHRSWSGTVKEIKRNKIIFAADKKLSPIQPRAKVKLLAQNDDELTLEDDPIDDGKSTSQPASVALENSPKDMFVKNYANPFQGELWGADAPYASAKMLRSNKSMFLAHLGTEGGSAKYKFSGDAEEGGGSSKLKRSGSDLMVSGFYAGESGLKIGGRIVQNDVTWKTDGYKIKQSVDRKSLIAAAAFRPNIGIGLEFAQTELKFDGTSATFSRILPSLSIMDPSYDLILSWKPPMSETVSKSGEFGEQSRVQVSEPGYIKAEGEYALDRTISVLGEFRRNLYRGIDSDLYKDSYGVTTGAVYRFSRSTALKGMLGYDLTSLESNIITHDGLGGMTLQGSGRHEFMPGHAASLSLIMKSGQKSKDGESIDVATDSLLFGYDATL